MGDLEEAGGSIGEERGGERERQRGRGKRGKGKRERESEGSFVSDTHRRSQREEPASCFPTQAAFVFAVCDRESVSERTRVLGERERETFGGRTRDSGSDRIGSPGAAAWWSEAAVAAAAAGGEQSGGRGMEDGVRDRVCG